MYNLQYIYIYYLWFFVERMDFLEKSSIEMWEEVHFKQNKSIILNVIITSYQKHWYYVQYHDSGLIMDIIECEDQKVNVKSSIILTSIHLLHTLQCEHLGGL